MNSFLFFAIVNLTLAICLSPLYISIIKKVKAFLQGRKGPGLFQTYRNLFKLLRKETLYSYNSSIIMRIAPYIDIICSLILVLFVPLIFIPASSVTFGNILLFVYLLMLSKFFIALAGLDAGSTFGGMGSSREMSLSAIIEPTIIVVFAALAFSFDSVNLFTIVSSSINDQNHFFLWLLFVPFILIFLTESARIPIDNPETHLELTMIHEAMILEQSGKNLAMIELSSAIKQMLFMGIIINLFFPIGITNLMHPLAILTSLLIFIGKTLLFAVGIGIIESYVAKLRLFRLPNIYTISYFLSLIAILFEVLL